jgi:hypothetical protein
MKRERRIRCGLLTAWVALCAAFVLVTTGGLVMAALAVVLAAIVSFLLAPCRDCPVVRTRIVQTFTDYPGRFQFEVRITPGDGRQRLEEILQNQRFATQQAILVPTATDEEPRQEGVEVQIHGHAIGTLKRHVLERWRALTDAFGRQYHTFAVPAQIRRDVHPPGSNRERIRVWLDLPIAEE